MQFAGVDNVKALVERMGITSGEGTWGLSSVLGALDVTPFEMVQAYTVLPTMGSSYRCTESTEITDSSGNVLYRYVGTHTGPGDWIRVAFLITQHL